MAKDAVQEDLFADFRPTSKEDWIQKITNDLKAKDYNSLISQTAEGIDIQPIYHIDELDPKPQPFRPDLKWDTVQEILAVDVHKANKEALEHLNRGATALLFYLEGHEDLESLLKDIEIEYIRLNFVVQENAAGVAQKLHELIRNRGLKVLEIAASINHDPLENLARTGNWFEDEEKDFEDLKNLHQTSGGNIKSLCLNVNLFGNAGANMAQQLGIALAMGYETHVRLHTDSLKDFWVNFAIGSDFFGEIAKLRAFRRLWVQLCSELNLEQAQPTIYAESALRNKSIKDAYNNMIRTTSEAMAAVIGGADEISVKAFNITFDEPGAFGERIAKNQSNILQHESHLDVVKDIAQGSYFIEDLTEKLAEKGWEFFKQIEGKGGFIESMKSGWLQDEIKASAAEEQNAFDEKKKVLIGANKYAKEDENLKEIIKHGMFSRDSGKNTEVKPIRAKRLSEGLERI